MSNFKVEFTLKQHTPIIHFQSEQSGATLRATELKPKFDKFLKEYVFKGILPEDFLINKDIEALNYKVSIKATTSEVSLPNSFLFFANNATGVEKKHTVKNQSIHVEFFSYKIELIKIIKESFNDFLLITNFGARSSKGYGSFSHTLDNREEVFKKYYPIVFKINDFHNILKWEDKVDTTHKLLKSGINFKSYHKSLLFQYMCSKNLRWEKRKIKEEFPSLAKGKEPIDCNVKKEYRYIRAMLGLAGINEYQGKQIVSISDKDKKIERFASPIKYKVVDNAIYLLCDKSYEKIMDKTFTFKYKGSSFDIKTPSKDQFDLYDFLKFVENQESIVQEVK
jgi:hypothetical protein